MSRQTPIQPPTLRSGILRATDILKRYQISLPTLFRWIRQNKFPKPFKLAPGARSTGWYESDIALWEETRRT
jgi:prophage regulatory protein